MNLQREAYWIGFVWGLSLAVIFIVFLSLVLGCSQPPRMFNQEDEQDLSCYGKYGGELGYCNKTLGRK